MTHTATPEDHVIVVFGATGDLARRKLLPALFHLAREDLLPKRYRIVGSSRERLSDAEFRDFACRAVDEFGRCEPDGDAWESFSESLSFVSGGFDPDNTEPLATAVHDAEAALGNGTRRLFYLAVPPVAFGSIAQGLGGAGLAEDARVIMEKPFGSDLDSARELNATVHSVFTEEQVFRIDHFLGKETVQNILADGVAQSRCDRPGRLRARVPGIPLQTAYCGAKHAIQGFTESLRCELIHDGIDVHLTMVQLPGLNTPQFQWARAKLPEKPQPVPPIYQPDVAARAVVWAARSRRRELYVGLPTLITIWGDKVAPWLGDLYLAKTAFESQQTGEPFLLRGRGRRLARFSAAGHPGSALGLAASPQDVLVKGVTMPDRMTPLGAVGRGLAAGLVGTAAMTAWQELSSRLEQSSGQPSDGGEEHDPWESAPAPAKVAKRLLEGVFRRDIPPEKIGLLTNMTHWGYGTAWGGVYGLVQGTLRANPLGAGLGLGAGVWVMSYVQLVPMGLYQPPWKYPAKTLAKDFSYHLVYGVGVSGAYDALSAGR